MNKYIVIFCFSLIALSSRAQNLSLSDLQNICKKTNWEYVNQYLMNKGWEFYDSEKGSSTQYNTITWSFNKSYGDNAEAWFYLFTYEGFPNKISYSVFNKSAYTKIQNSLKFNGYSLKDSEINDNELTSKYANNQYLLEITTEKREKKSDYSYYDGSITAYIFKLIKKSSIYDPDNGNKTDYWYSGDNIKAKYTLKDGVLDGKFTTYHYNGQIKQTGNYSNGVATGKFIEYDKEGNKSEEYLMSNDKKNGAYTGYLYDEGTLFLLISGNYIKNEKSGTWKTIVTEEGNERVLEFENYKYGLKNGKFQEAQDDSLITGNYLNDKLNGKYKVYLDFARMIVGGIIQTDTTKLTLVSEGYYLKNLKSGYWKEYDLTSSLRSAGRYVNDKQSGEWKHYYTKFADNDGGNYPYSNELYLVQNYSNGMLNGKTTRYSYLDKEEYPCSEEDKTKSSLDTCSRMVYQKVLETSYYKNDKLNGLFELKDSLGAIIAQGSFSNDLKNGEWLHRYSNKDLDGNTYFIYQKGSYLKDKREGKWVQYYKEGKITETFNYKNGDLHGEYVEWNKFNKPSSNKSFERGKFKELITYDSLGIHIKNKYEIYSDMNSYYKCRKTEYYNDGYASQEYWMKNDGDIDHSWYELTFALATRKYSDGSKGYKDGVFKLYDKADKPIVIGKYYKENKVGLWTTYYYDQSIKIESNFKDDYQTNEKYLTLNGWLFSGDFVYINVDENIKEVRSIKNGLRNGSTEFINMSTGKTIRKEKYKEGIRK